MVLLHKARSEEGDRSRALAFGSQSGLGRCSEVLQEVRGEVKKREVDDLSCAENEEFTSFRGGVG